MVPNISQTLLKSFTDYLNDKMCGLLFKAKYVDRDPDTRTPPSEAMKAGIYFEYLCTGALPMEGYIPQPVIVYQGTPKEAMSADYQRATNSARFFKKIIAHYDIKILEFNKKVAINGMVAVYDIIAEWKGQRCIIDLKYSGLMDDKWNELGWELDSLPLKDTLMIQGVHYKVVDEDSTGNFNTPFFFFVFDAKNDKNMKIIKQEVDEVKLAAHRVAIGNVIEMIGKNILHGFKAKPSLQRCSECPIANKCPERATMPLVDTVYY